MNRLYFGDNLTVLRDHIKDMRSILSTLIRHSILARPTMFCLVKLTEPTRPMLAEAAAAGYVKQSAHGRLPRIQIATIADLLNNRLPVLPPLPREQPSAPRTRRKRQVDSRQQELLLPIEGHKNLTDKGECVDPRFINIVGR